MGNRDDEIVKLCYVGLLTWIVGLIVALSVRGLLHV